MRSTIAGKLTGDGTLMALLTGGVYTLTEISRQYTPLAFDTNGEIKPCAFVKLESESPSGPYVRSGQTSERLFVVVYVYQRVGNDVIDPALERVFALLNYWKPTGVNTWLVQHAGDVRDVGDQALECSMGYGRYVATRMR